MKKIIKKMVYILIPYGLNVVWFFYCLPGIEEDVKNHLGYEWRVFDSIILALLSIIILVILRLCKREVYYYYFVPVLFVITGIIMYRLGAGIPCCTGG